MLLPFKVGLGGRIGSGQQWWSGISLADEVAALRFLIDHRELSGPVNVMAPEPARNADWTTLIGERLHRPTIMRLPATVLEVLGKPLGGQLAEMLLFGQRGDPAVLRSAGFEFTHPDTASILDWALQH
jgi:NAD dependent epimerase/dehydratase family enzyme